MRDLLYNSRQTGVTSVSEILGVGIPNNNSIYHITRHGLDNSWALHDRVCTQNKTDFAGC